MQITSEELIKLRELQDKGLASMEVVGEIFPNGIDERVLKIKRTTYCQYTGKPGPDQEYSIPLFDLRSVWTACDKQISALQKTVEVIQGMIKDVEAGVYKSPNVKKAKASR
jgi:hypothetical protein